jgi:prepilin-type N-terminal cleavage/methylation domain-containing protein
MKKGFSLIEMLIVLTVFAFLGIIITQSLASSLKGARKSEAIGNAKENIEYILNTVERTLRRVDTIGSDSTSIKINYFLTGRSTSEYFRCQGNDFFWVNDQKLNNPDIKITSCSFNYQPATSGVPASVTLSLTGESLKSTGVEGSSYSSSIKVLLRNYSGN